VPFAPTGGLCVVRFVVRRSRAAPRLTGLPYATEGPVLAHHDSQQRFEFSVAIVGVLRTWMDVRPSLTSTRMTHSGPQPSQNPALQHAPNAL